MANLPLVRQLRHEDGQVVSVAVHGDPVAAVVGRAGRVQNLRVACGTDTRHESSFGKAGIGKPPARGGVRARAQLSIQENAKPNATRC